MEETRDNRLKNIVSETVRLREPNQSVLDSVLSFFTELYLKKLEPLDLDHLFFSCPLDLFAFASNREPETVKQEFKESVRAVTDWTKEHNLLSFLQSQPHLVSEFLEDINQNIYTGLLLCLLSWFSKKRGKIYQFHDRKCLVSCDLGFDFEEVVRIAVIVFNNGFQFCPLKKIKGWVDL